VERRTRAGRVHCLASVDNVGVGSHAAGVDEHRQDELHDAVWDRVHADLAITVVPFHRQHSTKGRPQHTRERPHDVMGMGCMMFEEEKEVLGERCV
jgi:hypothetical protein